MIFYNFMFSDTFADITYCSSVSTVEFQVNTNKVNVPKPIKIKKLKNITWFNLVLPYIKVWVCL